MSLGALPHQGLGERGMRGLFWVVDMFYISIVVVVT